MNIPTNLSSFLTKLDLSREEIEIFWALTKYGSSTILEISRNTGINRTQVYRFLEKMKKEGLTEEIIEEHRTMAKATDINQLERLVKEKANETEQLKTLFPQVQQLLSSTVGQNQAETKVLFYRGQNGLQQMVWNTLKSKETIRGYTYRMLEDAVGENFAKTWAEEFVDRGLKGKDIFSDAYLRNRSETKRPNHLDIVNYNYKSRYISPETLNIDHQMDIYNDVVSFYNWFEGEVFGVEIYNQKVADFQKQIFEIIWDLGKEIELD